MKQIDTRKYCREFKTVRSETLRVMYKGNLLGLWVPSENFQQEELDGVTVLLLHDNQ